MSDTQPTGEATTANYTGPPIQIHLTRGGFSPWTWLGWASLLLWAGLLACGISILLVLLGRPAVTDYVNSLKVVDEQLHSGKANASEKIAIITVAGVIGRGDGFVKQQIDLVRKDPSVRAIVLRVDSPGGTVTGSDYIYHHLKQLVDEKRVPLVVSMGSMAASGGYYISMAVGSEKNVIFAEPTTTTGSIGVIIPHYDVSGLLERYDVKDDSIVSHPRKQMLAMTRPIPEEHREILQAYVDESFERFKEVVKIGRPHLQTESTQLEDPQTGQDLATGEIFTARQAERLGLVDRIGFIEDAIKRAAELAQLDAEKVAVVRYRRPLQLWQQLGFAEHSGGGLQLSDLLEATAPRAYYLCTTMPPLVSTR